MKKHIYTFLLVAMAFAFTACEDAVLSAPVGNVPENATAGQNVTQITITNTGNSKLESLVLSGSGAENFSVDKEGLITVANGAKLDFESVQVYNLMATATSTRGKSVSGDINIEILDVADVVPSISGFSTSFAEDIPFGTLVGKVDVTDSGDADIQTFTLGNASFFSINNKGEIRTNGTFDYEQTTGYNLSVYATNAAGNSNTVNVEISVTNVADVIPFIMGFETSIKQNVEVGTVVGTVDINSTGDSPITDFTISESDVFDISLEGVVTTKVLFEYDMKKVYKMSVVATNGAGTDTGFVQVTLLESFTVKPFTAKYYLEEDGSEAGKGTDGSDASIVPVLKATETVTRPAINYPWSNEFGIESYNLYAEWEGEIEVNEEGPINANFAVSWSDVSFFIDGELVSKWANSNKVIPLNLTVGTHSVRVEYHNHWHTTEFNVSFTNYSRTSVTEDLSPFIDETAQINYISAYSIATSADGSKYNEVTITLPESDRPQVIFLSSYAAVNWIIDNPYNTEIQGVVFKSHRPGTTVSNSGKGFVLYAPDFAKYDQALTVGTENVASMTGRSLDFLYEENYFKDIEIPSI